MSATVRWFDRLQCAVWILHGALAGGLFALVALPGRLPLLILATLLVLPLLLALPGLLRGRAYTASWATLLVAFYCALLLAEAVAQPAQRLALLGLSTLAALDFVALMLYAKAAKAMARG